MSVKTVLLGFLRFSPLHGYELKRIIERDMGDWADIAFGSIYFALDQLQKSGFVTAHTEESPEQKPSRIVYSITPQGEAEFFTLLRELWQDRSRKTSPVDIAIAFINELPKDEVKAFLEERIGYISQTLKYLDEHQDQVMAHDKVPRESRFIFSHARHQLKAELDWSKEVLASL